MIVSLIPSVMMGFFFVSREKNIIIVWYYLKLCIILHN